MDGAALDSIATDRVKLRRVWPLFASLLVLAVPTAVTLSDNSWRQESGAHAPIVVATGGWLLARQSSEFRRLAQPGGPILTTLMLAASLAMYVFGSAYDFVTIEAAGLYGAALAMFHSALGLRLMRRNWFPLVYLAFAIPLPDFVLYALTAPLKQFVSMVSTEVLSVFGLPIARQGVTIFVAEYQLLVEDACAGMNSLIGLTAISLFYIYLVRRASFAYTALLTCFVIPIAILSNVVRVTLLILITYLFGDAAGQGFAHFTAGALLFATALLIVFILDHGLAFLLSRKSGR